MFRSRAVDDFVIASCGTFPPSARADVLARISRGFVGSRCREHPGRISIMRRGGFGRVSPKWGFGVFARVGGEIVVGRDVTTTSAFSLIPLVRATSLRRGGCVPAET